MDFQELLQNYRSYADSLGNSIIQWARPVGWGEAPTSDWPLAKFDVALGIAIGYLLFVLFGSAIMSSCPPVPNLKPFQFIYNMVQVMLCSYMCIEAGVRAYDAGYNLLPCNNFDQKKPPIAFILYVFYLSKILDFLDTVFIILEKRWKQLSFLHVYHHTSIFLVSAV
jgi:elongation of very long chain fatty acids protein 4